MTRLQKPDKVYLAKPNLPFALNAKSPAPEMLRETFFVNQVGKSRTVEYAEEGDFWISQQLAVEVGGRSKGFKQVQGTPNSIVTAGPRGGAKGAALAFWVFVLIGQFGCAAPTW